MCLLSDLAAAEPHWPQLRGPGALGVADDANFPESWSADQNVVWKQPIAGRGWSSPIVAGDRVFLTTAVNQGPDEEPRKGLYFGGNRSEAPTTPHQWKVVCLDIHSGNVLWQRVAHEGAPTHPLHVKNSYASETPVTDGQRVYAYFGNVGVFCYDLEGKPLWSRRFEPVKTRYGWGTAASPALHEDRLYIVNDNDEQSYLVALDARTGDEVWRVDRDEQSNWATPYIWRNELRTEIITPGTVKVRSYDLSGKLLYELGGMSTISIPTPFSRFGLLYVSSGYILDRKKPVFAIRPGATGDISLADDENSNEYIQWSQKMAGPYNPSPLVYGDLLYVLLDRGLLVAYDAHTGEEVYGRQRLPGSGAYTSSPWASRGKIYCLDEDGTTVVVQAGPEFKVIGSNALAEDDMCMATPAIAGNRLLLRTSARLYCIGNTDAAE
jgi:outer membrane protein assembly factor BamB